MAAVEYVWNENFTLTGEYSKAAARESPCVSRKPRRSVSLIRMSGALAISLQGESGTREQEPLSPLVSCKSEDVRPVRKTKKMLSAPKWAKKHD
eukprot:CAMPEP_0185835656 /NCGR_PEP_ID=MMETSP1353-20130828/8202_1 /TAXON_ID=1077150 /ORGANISM="Erythrolobus australicus, Strain CCMP3124" /LENGTH=93 /DNA_ID=CAMNT_0028534323 /DNA_START=55 /DNA_END=333 /DNA_ORIENTATION=+